MTGKEVLVLIALFAIAAAAAKQEPRHPPNHHQHGHGHHDHDPIPTDLQDPQEAPINLTPEQPLDNQEAIVVEEEDGSKDVEAEDEVTIDEEVSEDARKSLKTRQEEIEDEEDNADEKKNRALWVDCDYSAIPRISCHDCQTRVFCKYPGGGKLVTCKSPLKPYCNNGVCSAVPSSGCA